MSEPNSSSRHLMNARPSLVRVLIGKSFSYLALGATFFGLAMLIIFLVSMGRGVVSWFQAMPPMVEVENEQLKARSELARDREAFIKVELKAFYKERDRKLELAPDEATREKIRKDYAELEETELPRIEKKRQQELNAENFIRNDTSPLALLGHFLSNGPSDKAHDAGILPALLGSLMLGIITILVAVPLGVGAAIYLEEYRQNSWLARIIQVNINNLAGVPSIMFGILGSYVFVDLIFTHLEVDAGKGEGFKGAVHSIFGSIKARNVLGGGLTLALLTLPVIIVASQEAIRAVPSSLRHASIALGATRWQTIWRVVLPSSLPGVLTGSILALSRALGEAAPLVFFGAILYVDVNPTPFSRFTVLPTQIFNWSQRPGFEWKHNAAMASAVLLITLLALNAVAIILRQRAQRYTRW